MENTQEAVCPPELAEEATEAINHAYLGVCCSILLCLRRGHWDWAQDGRTARHPPGSYLSRPLGHSPWTPK